MMILCKRETCKKPFGWCFINTHHAKGYWLSIWCRNFLPSSSSFFFNIFMLMDEYVTKKLIWEKQKYFYRKMLIIEEDDDDMWVLLLNKLGYGCMKVFLQKKIWVKKLTQLYFLKNVISLNTLNTFPAVNSINSYSLKKANNQHSRQRDQVKHHRLPTSLLLFFSTINFKSVHCNLCSCRRCLVKGFTFSVHSIASYIYGALCNRVRDWKVWLITYKKSIFETFIISIRWKINSHKNWRHIVKMRV